MIEVISGVILGAIASWVITHFYYRRSNQDSTLFIKKIDFILSKIEDLDKQMLSLNQMSSLAKDAKLLKEELHKKFDIFEELEGTCPECGYPLEKIIDDNDNISARCNNPACIERMSSY